MKPESICDNFGNEVKVGHIVRVITGNMLSIGLKVVALNKCESGDSADLSNGGNLNLYKVRSTRLSLRQIFNEYECPECDSTWKASGDSPCACQCPACNASIGGCVPVEVIPDGFQLERAA